MDVFGFNIPTWCLLLVLVLFLYYTYMNSNRGVFKKMGVPEVYSFPVIGSMLDFTKLGLHGSDMKWCKKYGKVYGFFDPLEANLVIADPEMLREILVKQFNNFQNRRSIEGLNGILNLGLTNLKGENWKYVRNTVTPTFSTGKLRRMFRLVERASDNLVTTLANKLKTETEIEMKRLFGGYTMDVIASTAFGIEVDSQKNPDDPFVKNAKIIMDTSFATPMVLICSFFPFLIPAMVKLKMSIFPWNAQTFFRKVIKEVFQQRKKEKKTQMDYDDFLQLMKDAHHEESSENGKNDSDEKKGLTDEEIVAQALIFLIAGYDTTALLLTWTFYIMASNPDKQEKLRDEIETKLKGKKVDYDSVMELEYLDMCINETLRIFPPLVRFDRKCTSDTEVAGLKIKRGMVIAVPVYAIHHDPDVWENPEKFEPERFSHENKASHGPFDFLPFGYGPRNCIGMRLAYAEAKLAIVKLIREYNVSVGSKTEIPPKLQSMSGFLKPVEMFLKVEKIH